MDSYIGVKLIKATPCSAEKFAKLNAAKAAHQANKEYCESMHDYSQPDWENAHDWQKESVLDGVEGVLNGNTPEQSHESWLKHKKAHGWTFGEVKDPEKKEHPCMVPYNQLPEEQKKKDSIFINAVKEELKKHEHRMPNNLGYLVVYPDGYESWSPKDVFEKAYFRLNDESKITEDDLVRFMGKEEVKRIDTKTTLVSVKTLTGFVEHQVSSCVDPKNYDEEIGKRISLNRIKDKLYPCFGFLLQWAKNGLKE